MRRILDYIDTLKTLAKSVDRGIENNSYDPKVGKFVKFGVGVTRMLGDMDSPFFVTLFNLQTKEFVYVSENSSKILGYDHSELEGTNYESYLVHADDFISGSEAIEERKEGEVSVSGFVNTYRHADGIHGVELEWYGEPSDGVEVFCIAIPRRKIKIKTASEK